MASSEPERCVTKPQQAPVDPEKLPKSFVETIPVSEVQFEMILVPGDAEQGIEPFYIGKHEVTWDEYAPWMCDGYTMLDKHLGWTRGKAYMYLYPSDTPYSGFDRKFGTDGMPALGVGWLGADVYCKFLSVLTGKHYRLPTEAEWVRAYEMGGGDISQPMTEEQANQCAVWMGNSRRKELDNRYSTRKVGSMKPNALGIHDMAGNVCEWVIPKDGQRVVRGGHFDGEFAEWGGALKYQGCGRFVENLKAWNASWPVANWFNRCSYTDADWVGIRLVCEAASVGQVEDERGEGNQ